MSNNLAFGICYQKDPAMYLVNSEINDKYFEICKSSPQNVKARYGQVVYSGNNISEYEYNHMYNYVGSLYDRLPKRLMKDLEKVRIIQIMPYAEGGMSHTRSGDYSSIDGIICFTDVYQIYTPSILIHNLWHIHQRKYKDLWSIIFAKQGWKEWKGKLPNDLEENRRYNPDTIDCPLWIFEDKWIPIPIFGDISNPKIGEVDVWFYNPEKRIRTRNIPGELLSYYSDSLPSVAFEHPRELSAYLLSEPHKYENSRCFKDLIKELDINCLSQNSIDKLSQPYKYENSKSFKDLITELGINYLSQNS